MVSTKRELTETICWNDDTDRWEVGEERKAYNYNVCVPKGTTLIDFNLDRKHYMDPWEVFLKGFWSRADYSSVLLPLHMRKYTKPIVVVPRRRSK